ncbi:MAG: hypothetical protein SO010_08380 [Candidatus Limiplasma sp.]|nr:hypothetical protein [Candidatus Limiplasma sp.]
MTVKVTPFSVFKGRFCDHELCQHGDFCLIHEMEDKFYLLPPLAAGLVRHMQIIFLSKELAILLLCMGFPEFLRTKEYCDNKRRNRAIFSFIVGISACIRGFL